MPASMTQDAIHHHFNNLRSSCRGHVEHGRQGHPRRGRSPSSDKTCRWHGRSLPRIGLSTSTAGRRRNRRSSHCDPGPMANDFRTIASAIHIVTDLERMADHAAGIAKIVIQTADRAIPQAARRHSPHERDRSRHAARLNYRVHRRSTRPRGARDRRRVMTRSMVSMSRFTANC